MILIKEKKNEVKHRVNFLAVEVIKCENFLWIWCFPI